MSQVGELKYIADKWSVEIDGYSIPFPELKLARAYLHYIRLWQSEGELISYDHANQTLFWRKCAPEVSQLSRHHRGVPMARTTDCYSSL